MVTNVNNSSSDSKKAVQVRLLDAAEQLFSEHGFDATSVRDIAAEARCNLASVNYYFGGKDKLYQEVWRRQLKIMREKRLASIEKVMNQQDKAPILEDLLKSFAEAFIEPMLDVSRARRLLKLMAREMVDQHLSPEIFIKEMIIPTMSALGQALTKICPGLNKKNLHMLIMSITAQLVHIVHTKAVMEQIQSPELPKFDLSEVVNHVIKFSTAGIRAYAEGEIK